MANQHTYADPEVKAMQQVAEAIRGLDRGGQIRVLDWAQNRFVKDTTWTKDELNSWIKGLAEATRALMDHSTRYGVTFEQLCATLERLRDETIKDAEGAELAALEA